VQAQAVADVAAIGLDQDMRGFNAVLRHVRHGIEDPVHHIAIHIAGQGEPRFLVGLLLVFAHGRSTRNMDVGPF
jgi:hypothetical protein